MPANPPPPGRHLRLRRGATTSRSLSTCSSTSRSRRCRRRWRRVATSSTSSSCIRRISSSSGTRRPSPPRRCRASRLPSPPATSSTRLPAPGPLIPPPARSPSPAAQPDNPGKTPPSPTGPKVVRDKRTGKTNGYGFVSFSNPTDLAAAIKEMNGKYVGNRPIKLRKSNWKERTDVEGQVRQKNHVQRKPKMPKKSILHK